VEQDLSIHTMIVVFWTPLTFIAWTKTVLYNLVPKEMREST